MSKQKITEIGRVTEALAAARFKVKLNSGIEVICYLAGRIRKNRVKIIVGDKVDVAVDPAGGTATNRITWRR